MPIGTQGLYGSLLGLGGLGQQGLASTAQQQRERQYYADTLTIAAGGTTSSVYTIEGASSTFIGETKKTLRQELQDETDEWLKGVI